MRKLTGEEIRRTWIAFFESKGHKWMPGVSLIPEGDKSLLWVNAGVTGLKKYFDGSEIPPSRRIVNVQKSIRTNDIENVGHTARHHTFFEMLGNFSIGDYFRKEVIPWAYEILTSEKVGFGLDPKKLYVTYNPDDHEAYELWQKVGIERDHLIPLEGNFWQIGEGPCGPNTEVFYDRGESYDPKHLGKKLLEDDIENDRYIELWGIVFSQFNAENGVARKDYKELPSKNIDTGAGLERIACILQGTKTNFETDLFKPIIEEVERLSDKKYEGGNLLPFRVIADHARCLTFALGDGASFSNEGRGYVLRRLIRRAMLYGQKLGLNEPFMHKLVHVVTEKYKDFYPELLKTEEKTVSEIKNEEIKFEKTLVSGEALLRSILEKGVKELSGEDAFKLYDTYGFPLDLTKELCAENGVSVDEKGFAEKMEEQRQRARDARGEIESFHKQSKDLLACKEKSEFVYGIDSLKTAVLACFIDGERVSSLHKEGEFIAMKTPFYSEMGGQVGDTGTFVGEGVKGKVIHMGLAPNGQHLHKVEIEEGDLKEGMEITLSIDSERRRLIERNHSATHLLHSALSHVLSSHVDQKGSYVDENYLRFDYALSERPSKEQLRSIEREVNEQIADGIEEKTLILPIEEAKKTGAEMEFSEKYGDSVRVVTFGEYSKEFCGGTHVENSADIGLFTILSDEAIASGIRRITAKTSLGALEELKGEEALYKAALERFGGNRETFLTRLDASLEENKALHKELGALKDKLASLEAKDLVSSVKKVGDIAYLLYKKEGASKEDLFSLSDRLKSGYPDCCFFLLGGEEGKRPALLISLGKATSKVDAGKTFKEIAKVLGGGGGGKPTMANGQLKSAKDLEKIDALLLGRLH